MKQKQAPAAARLGYWAGIATTVFSLVYVVGQVAEWLGWLGSKGGPESTSTPLGIIVLLLPSLLLAPSFALLMVALHHRTEPERSVWSLAAVVFAGVYTVMVAINYYVQLTFVAPHLARGELAAIQPFLFTPFNSFLYSVDVLGYSFMCLSTFFGAFALSANGQYATIRRLMLANGAILPFLAFQIFYHPLIWPASLWAIVFPAMSILLTKLFRRAASSGDRSSSGSTTGNKQWSGNTSTEKGQILRTS